MKSSSAVSRFFASMGRSATFFPEISITVRDVSTVPFASSRAFNAPKTMAAFVIYRTSLHLILPGKACLLCVWRLFGTRTKTEVFSGDVSGYRSQEKARDACHHSKSKERTQHQWAILRVEQ